MSRINRKKLQVATEAISEVLLEIKKDFGEDTATSALMSATTSMWIAGVFSGDYGWCDSFQESLGKFGKVVSKTAMISFDSDIPVLERQTQMADALIEILGIESLGGMTREDFIETVIPIRQMGEIHRHTKLVVEDLQEDVSKIDQSDEERAQDQLREAMDRARSSMKKKLEDVGMDIEDITGRGPEDEGDGLMGMGDMYDGDDE